MSQIIATYELIWQAVHKPDTLDRQKKQDVPIQRADLECNYQLFSSIFKS